MNAFPCKFSALKGAWKRKGPGARLDGWLWRDCARGGDSQIQEVLETPQTNTKQLHPPAIKKKIVLSLFSSYFKCPRDTNHINSLSAKSFLNTNWFQASLGVCDDKQLVVCRWSPVMKHKLVFVATSAACFHRLNCLICGCHATVIDPRRSVQPNIFGKQSQAFWCTRIHSHWLTCSVGENRKVRHIHRDLPSCKVLVQPQS